MKRTAKSVTCPTCGARRGESCKGSRAYSSSTLGGGWGGRPELKRSHKERVEKSKDE